MNWGMWHIDDGCVDTVKIYLGQAWSDVFSDGKIVAYAQITL